jgi:sensor domain CHASE-containing protein
VIGGAIAALVPWELLAWGVGGLVAVLAAWIAGNRKAALRAENEALRDAIKAHEVRNEVENRIAAERDALGKLRRDWSE